MKDAVIEAGFISAQQKSEVMTENFHNFFLSKCLNCQFIGTLSGTDFRGSGELGGSIPDGGHLEGKLRKFFLSVRRPSAEHS